MEKRDFIPSADGKYYEWGLNLLDYINFRMISMNITQEQYDLASEPFLQFEVDYKAAINPTTRTTAAILAKTESKSVSVKAMRLFNKQCLAYNPNVSDSDRANMGLPIHKETRSPVPDPTTIPEANVLLPAPAVVQINFRDKDSESKSKPVGVHGCEVGWEILEVAPTDWSQLKHSSFDTHTPLELTFSGDDRGHTLYFALRWENTRGVKGHWSEIQSAIIP
jgi:hypothetical protein